VGCAVALVLVGFPSAVGGLLGRGDASIGTRMSLPVISGTQTFVQMLYSNRYLPLNGRNGEFGDLTAHNTSDDSSPMVDSFSGSQRKTSIVLMPLGMFGSYTCYSLLKQLFRFEVRQPNICFRQTGLSDT
jgi:hypothetical protein